MIINKKTLKKSISALISASTILCTCPQTYAKINIDSQKIVSSAKTVGKYIAPLGAALATGLIIGTGYGKYQDLKIDSNIYFNNYWPYARYRFVSDIFNMRCFCNIVNDDEGKLYDETVNFLYLAITSNEERMYERVNFNKGDEVLFVGRFPEYCMDEHRFAEIIEHIVYGGKVVFLGDIVSGIDYVNLECILSILELKYKFPSNVLILTNNNERELLRNRGARITKCRNFNISDDTLNNIRNLLCRFIEHTPDYANISDNIYCGVVHDRNLLRSNSNKKIFTLNESIESEINSNVISLDGDLEGICMSKLTIDEENGEVR